MLPCQLLLLLSVVIVRLVMSLRLLLLHHVGSDTRGRAWRLGKYRLKSQKTCKT
jgi:hypothetical protein